MVFTLVGTIAIIASTAIGVAEGAIYFRNPDSAFQNEYVASRRLWF